MDKIEYGNLTTPCFILDKEMLVRSIREFRRALDRHFPRNTIGYSVKTNSLPGALVIAREAGCDAEVVSHDEYRLARLCGFTPDRIIYNGPMKSKETFLEAVTGGACVNLETQREIEWLRELPEDGQYEVGIRLNVDITKVSPEDGKPGEEFSRFGFCFENGELEAAIRRIQALPNARVAGLHLHRTSKTRSTRFYANLIKYASGVIDSIGLKLKWLDIGGSYFGIFPNAPTFEDYAKAIYEAMLRGLDLTKLNVIVEPGNALLAAAFSYLSTVIDVKRLENVTVVTTDGTRNDVDPLFAKKDYLKEIIYCHGTTETTARQWICGATCLEFDRLFELTGQPALSVGDKILYNNVGAYTMCLTPMFINYFPRVYLLENGRYTLTRDKWGAEECLIKSNLAQ